MEAIHDLWGRPVNVHTVWYDLGALDELEEGTRQYWYWNWRSHPQAIERVEEAQEWRYDPHSDGDDFEVNELDDDRLDELRADPTDYYTVPDDWF